MSETLVVPWLVEVLVNECERTPATELAPFVARANDLLERLGHVWRINHAGEPVQVPA